MQLTSPTPAGGDLAPVLERYNRDPTYLLQILSDVQEREGWISPDAVGALAEALGITPAVIEATLHFYSFLHAEPAGRYRILFSDNITDRMQGNLGLADRMARKLKVAIGSVSSNGLVGLGLTSCTGMSDQGPAILVNGRTIARMTAERVDRVCDLVTRMVPLAQWPEELFVVETNIRRADLLLSTPVVPGKALKAAIERGREGALAEIEASGLRGCGGAGFPVGQKWRAARNAPGETRYVVCNCDEGEPGTFKDRVLMQAFSGRVFEGMAISAWAIEATRGYVYLRAEYAYLRPALEAKLAQMRQANLLGKSIQGQAGFDFDIEIHMGAGAYICGEETALLSSLEGKPGRPRIRPPFPVTRGLFDQPTIVNNVETLAAAALISETGAKTYRLIGTARSPGTKLLSVSGDCDRPGIYEYPYGVTIERVLGDCGASRPMAVQVSGAAGTCLAKTDFTRSMSFEDVPSTGSFMVLGEHRDVFEMVRNFAHFFAHESCGFCTPCRVGTALVSNLVDEIANGRGTHQTVSEIRRLADLMRATSHCGLGQMACKALGDTLTKFRPAWDRRLRATDFEPAFNLDQALEDARAITGRDDIDAHLVHAGE